MKLNYKQFLILLGGIVLVLIIFVKHLFITEYSPGKFYMSALDYIQLGFTLTLVAVLTIGGIKYLKK